MAQLNLGRVKGDKGDKGNTPTIDVSANITDTIGVPSVNVTKTDTADGAVFNFTFNNVKGEKGEQGAKGESPLTFSFDGTTLTIVEK